MVSVLLDQEGSLPQAEKANYPKKQLRQQNYQKDRPRKGSAREHRTTGGPYTIPLSEDQVKGLQGLLYRTRNSRLHT